MVIILTSSRFKPHRFANKYARFSSIQAPSNLCPFLEEVVLLCVVVSDTLLYVTAIGAGSLHKLRDNAPVDDALGRFLKA